ncbi:MAG: DUF3795 domain-containing protein [Vicinamibacteria bacterium]|nr:DUF3795 domain-containing protein [Vicinamibacteria bacterium]
MKRCTSRRMRRKFLSQAAAVVGGGLCGGMLGAVPRRPPEAKDKNKSQSREERSHVNGALLGYCGLYCGGCSLYQETKAGAKPTADGKSAAPCEGCASAVVASWCADCAIKACAREKGVRYCLLCDEYPCAKLTEFTNDPRYPYHKEVHRDMARLKEIGEEAWMREQSARWTCSKCGGTYHWFARKCPACGTRVNEKYWPDNE